MKNCIVILVVAIFLYVAGCNSSSKNENVLDGSKSKSGLTFSEFAIDLASTFYLSYELKRLERHFYINSIPYEASVITTKNGLEYYSLNMNKNYGIREYELNDVKRHTK